MAQQPLTVRETLWSQRGKSWKSLGRVPRALPESYICEEVIPDMYIKISSSFKMVSHHLYELLFIHLGSR